MAKSRVLIGAATSSVAEMRAEAAFGAPTPSEVESFYAVGAIALQVLEALEGRGRRLGPAADANWKAFRGDFTDTNRLQFLLWDASFRTPACSPREVFRMHWLPEDDPWNADFSFLPMMAAARLLREAKRPLALDVDTVMGKAARAWQLCAGADPSLEQAAASIGPATRVVACGLDAIMALARRAFGRRDMDLGDQVTLIATAPWERQLFGLATLLSGAASTRARMLTPEEATPAALGRIDVELREACPF